jgi:hypothetical protein
MTDEEKFELLADKHRISDSGKIVHIGIIDYLTRYTNAKKVERFCRSLQAPADEISVAPPDFYGKRFQTFMRNNVFC